MSEGRSKGVCPRLVDYLCIVGANNPPHRPCSVQPPELLARYPRTDHQDFPLPRDMVYFCQPDGCTFTSPRRPQARETTSFVFTLTDKDSGITRYGVCLNFYRGVERRGAPPAANKRDSWTRGTDRSTDSAFSSDYKSHSTMGPSDSDREREEGATRRVHRSSEEAAEYRIPEEGARASPRVNRRGRDSESKISGGNDSDVDLPDTRQRRSKDSTRTASSRSQSLTSVCLLSSHPFFSSFRSCLATLKRLVEASAAANCRWRGGTGGRVLSGRREADSVWSVLAGGGADSASSFLLHDIREIEIWILRLLSAPIPVSNRTRLELEIIDRRFGPLLIFALPDPTRFSLCDFPLHLPLELLGVDTTLQVLTLIMLENKLVLQSRDLNALSLSVLALTNLLYPLQYMFPVIPILPPSMQDSEQLLLAPTPYIIGIPSSFLNHKKHITVPEDVWLVDLDSGKLTCPPSASMEEIPPLPEPEGKTLRNHLKQALASMSIQPITNLDAMPPDKVAQLLKSSRDWEESPGSYNPLIYGNDVDSVDIATRVAMVRFFNSPNMLANFNEHTRTLRLYPRPVVAFQVNSLIRSRPKPTPFISKFAATQAVEFYAEWILMPSNLAYQRIHTGLFDPTVIGDKFKWYAHNLEPVSFIVWDNLSSLNQALKSLKETDTQATDESGSDSDWGSSSSSFSSVSDLGGQDGPASLTNVIPPTPEEIYLPTPHLSGLDVPTSNGHRTPSPQSPAASSFPGTASYAQPAVATHIPRRPPRGPCRPPQPYAAAAVAPPTGLYGAVPLAPGPLYHTPPSQRPPLRPAHPSTRYHHPPPEIENETMTSPSQFPEESCARGPPLQLPPRLPGAVGRTGGPRHPPPRPPPYQLVRRGGPRPGPARPAFGHPPTVALPPRLRSNNNTIESPTGNITATGLDTGLVYQPPQQLQVPGSTRSDAPFSPPTSEDSHSEAESLSPVPGEHLPVEPHLRPEMLDRSGEEVFTSESENSSATCKTVRHAGGSSRKFSPSASASCGSELSLVGSEAEGSSSSRLTAPLNKLAANFSVKFPRSRFSESSSSSDSRKVSDSRQSSTEEVAQELFHNIEQFTKQAKKAAESLETVGKSAMMASKSKVIAKGLVDKDTMEDLETMKKNVVDDIKTAIEKKNEILKSLGDSAEKNQVKTDSFVRPHDDDEEEEEEEEVHREQELKGKEVNRKEVEEPVSYNRSDSQQGLSSIQAGAVPERPVAFSRQTSLLSRRVSVGEDHEVFYNEETPTEGGAFLANIGTDLSGLANQTSDFIGNLFGRGTRSTPGSQTGSPTSTPRASFSSRLSRGPQQGPFPKGRRGIVERSSLIRHPSSRSMDTSRLQQNLEQKNAITAENHAFIKEVVEQVNAGEGVGWLKISRLKKLMEDENYRNIILTKMNRTIDRKMTPDDHVEDVCLKRAVYKGMLKILLTVIHGLEVSLANFGVGGMASAYQLLEISHTHYWTKDVLENAEQGLVPASCPTSTASSPIYGSSRDILPASYHHLSLTVPGSPRSLNLDCEDNFNSLSSRDDSGDSRKSSNSERETAEPSTSDMLKELLHQKKLLFMGRLASLDSETESESCANSESGSIITNPAFQRNRGILSSVRSTVSDTEMDGSSYPASRAASGNLYPCKSSLTSGYRYHGGGVVTTVKTPSPEAGRAYLFEAILTKDRGLLWDNVQFWEDIFLDAVAQERELVGMDTGAEVMMERYRGLCENEKKRLEQEEDRLLSTMLFNLVAFMVMMNLNKVEIKKKVRRLLGKSHIGLIHSQEIHLLLDKLHQLNANDIDLKPLLSRQVNRQSFTVHAGTDASGDLLFLEVRDDGMVLRTVNGTIAERWFFERLVNMTYSPKNKVLCLWRRQGGQTQLHKYYTKKCKDLYYCIKGAMERAAARGSGGVTPGMELGGEFPVQDIQSGEGGLLQVCMEGVGLLFANSKFFVRLDHIRKCFTQKEGIFVLEEFNPKTRKMVQRKYKSAMADQICYAVLCVFSYVAAGQDRGKLSAEKSGNGRRQTGSHLSSGGISPRGPLYSDRHIQN